MANNILYLSLYLIGATFFSSFGVSLRCYRSTAIFSRKLRNVSQHVRIDEIEIRRECRTDCVKRDNKRFLIYRFLLQC